MSWKHSQTPFHRVHVNYIFSKYVSHILEYHRRLTKAPLISIHCKLFQDLISWMNYRCFLLSNHNWNWQVVWLLSETLDNCDGLTTSLLPLSLSDSLGVTKQDNNVTMICDFTASYPIIVSQKSVLKHASDDHVTERHSDGRKCLPIAKCLNVYSITSGHCSAQKYGEQT